MKILCVIDHFGSGGAQRQMVTLACGLKQRGHAVEVFTYFPDHSFFRQQVTANGIPVHEFRKGKGFSFGVFRKLSSLIRSGCYDIVVSFLSSPNVYSELSCAMSRSAKLVVSERGSHFGDKSRIGALIRRTLHRLADRVIVNSVSHHSWLTGHCPWMIGRVSTIYNGVELEKFPLDPNRPLGDLRLLIVGRLDRGKNIVTLLEALQLFHDTHGWVPQVSWAGRRDRVTAADRAYCQRVDELLNSLPEVRRRWHWLGERSDVSKLLREHHALIHPTLHEGLPNVICEALAAGRPVLASDVCDNGLLVSEGERGFLFDPKSPESIVDAIDRLLALSDEEWVRMSKAARAYAEIVLSRDRFVAEYENLFVELAAGTTRV
jgi:glycosyltransferase involved in cell wall biosynthesis